MTKHTLVPNNFYFMKPNKIVKQQTNLLATGQAHLTGSFFFPSPFELSLFTIYYELKKIKIKSWFRRMKMSIYLKFVKV